MTPSLEGIRVVDMGWSWAGPYAGMILADLGAEVLKLESAGRIDILRWSGAFADGLRDYERSGYYTACNRGKKSFTVNLKHEQSTDVVLRLVEQCDVLIENFAPRVLPALGLSAQVLRERNPRLIVLSMSGYGASGSESAYLSYGDHLLHASGIASLTGAAEDPPTKVGIFYGDPVGGMYGALAVLAALRDRKLTGNGCHLQLSQLEGLISLIPAQIMRQSSGEQVSRRNDKSDKHAPHGFYRCAGNDAWVALAVTGDDQWRLLSARLQEDGVNVPILPTAAERVKASPQVDECIGRWCATRSPWQVTLTCQQLGIAAYPVQSAPRLLFDDHLAAREFFPVVHRPVVGPGPIPGVVFRTSGKGSQVRGYAPLLGEHNEQVYKELLGFTEDQYQEGIASGLIS